MALPTASCRGRRSTRLSGSVTGSESGSSNGVGCSPARSRFESLMTSTCLSFPGLRRFFVRTFCCADADHQKISSSRECLASAVDITSEGGARLPERASDFSRSEASRTQILLEYLHDYSRTRLGLARG